MTSKEKYNLILKQQILSNFPKEIQNKDSLNQFKQVFKELIESGELPSNFGENAEAFLNGFCITLIDMILESRSSDYSDINPLFEVLNSITYLFSNFITSKYSNFLQKSSKIFTNINSPIYESTKKEGEKYSFIYSKLLSQLSTPQFLSELEILLDQSHNISFERLEFILSLITFLFNTGIYNFHLDEFMMHAIQCHIEKCTDMDESLFNSENIILIEKIFDSLTKLSTNDHQKSQISLAKVALDVKFSISDQFEKQTQGIVSLKQKLSESEDNELIDFILKAGLISNLKNQISIQNLSHFFEIFSKIISQDKMEEADFEKLWSITIKQDEISIQKYFKNWCNLLRNLQEKVTKPFFNSIISIDFYNESILKFLKIVVFVCPEEEKTKIFRQISDKYFEIEKSDELYIELILTYLPSDKEIQNKMINKCLSFISQDNVLDLAIPLLSHSCKNIKSERAHSIYENVTIVNHKGIINLFKILLEKIEKNLEEKEFEKLKEFVKVLSEKYMKEISDFLESILESNKDLFSQEMVLDLLQLICNLDSNSPSKKVISIIYKLLTQEQRVKGCEMLWELLVRNGDEEIADFVVQIYQTQVPYFIEKCNEKGFSCGSLLALFKMIHLIEDGVDRKINKFIPINKFEPEADLVKINFVGYISQSFSVPFYLSFENFKKRVSSLISVNEQCFSFIQRNRVVTKDTFKLINNDVFEIKVWYSMEFEKNLPKVFPSQILSQDKYQKDLFDILNRNDRMSKLSLQVLNLLPTLESQNEILRKTQFNPKEWANFLQTKNRYLFLYRLNLVGSILQGKHLEWIKFFYESGGVKVLLGILIFCVRKCFDEDEIELILEVTKISIFQEFFNEKEMNSVFDPKNLSALVQFAIDYAENERILLNLLLILQKFNLENDKIENFTKLFDITIFHSNKMIRETISTIIMKQTTENQERFLLSNLETSSKQKFTDFYFVLLQDFASKTEKTEKLWSETISILFDLYYPPQTDNVIEKLNYKPNDFIYCQNLFVILDKLRDKFDILPNSRKLFVFLISDILFSGYKFYIPSKEIFNLIFTILDQNPEFCQPLFDKLNQIQDLVYKMPSNLPEIRLTGYDVKKGIFNPGKIDYISVILMSLFGLTNFRNEFMGKISENWMSEIQFLFGEILFSPSFYVNSFFFLEKFSFDDGVQLDVTQQGDSLDFYKFFVNNSSLKNYFSGKISKYLIDNTKITEDFDVLSLDVEKFNSLEESLKNYLRSDKKIVEEKNESDLENPPEPVMKKDEQIEEDVTFTNFVNSIQVPKEEETKTDEMNTDEIKRIKFVKAPKVLVFKLNRFVRNENKTIEKTNKKFSFPFELDISDELDISLSTAKYELNSIVAHQGNYLSGHFTCYTKLNNEKWVLFDDHNSFEVDLETVKNNNFGGFENIEYFDSRTLQMSLLQFEKSTSGYLLFYSKIKSNSKEERIDDLILEETTKRIKYHLFKYTSTNPEFSKLVLKVSDVDSTGMFLYKNLITFTQSSFLTEENSLPLVEKFCEMMSENHQIAEFVLTQDKDVDNLLIICNNQTTRKVYSLILSEALNFACQVKKLLFTEFLANKIVSQSEMISSSWRNLDEFWAVVKRAVELTDDNEKEIFFEAIFVFVKTVLPLHSMNFPDENVISSINVDLVFEILIMTFSTDQTKKFKESFGILQKEFIETWIKPLKHTKSFITFISRFIGDDPKYANMLKTIILESSKQMTALLSSAYITLGLFMDGNVSSIIIDTVMKVITSKSPEFIANVIEEAANRLNYCINLKNSSTIENVYAMFIPYLLNENQVVREASQKLLIATLPPPLKHVDIVVEEEPEEKEENNYFVQNKKDDDDENEGYILKDFDDASDIENNNQNDEEDLDEEKIKQKMEDKIKVAENMKQSSDLDQFKTAFNIMLSYLPDLVSITHRIVEYFGDFMYNRREVLTFFPAPNYFVVLKEIMKRSQIFGEFYKNSGLFVDAISNFGKDLYSPNQSLAYCFDFFYFSTNGKPQLVWNTNNSAKFFKSFDYFRRNFPNISSLRNLLSLVTKSEVLKFFSSSLFYFLVRDCMCDDLYHFIVNNVNEENYSYVTSLLFSDDVIRMSVISKYSVFFALSSRILEKIPKSSDDFFDFERIRFYLVNTAKYKSPLTLLIIDILTNFNKSFVLFNKEKKNLFGGLRTDKLSNLYLYKIQIEFGDLFDMMMNSHPAASKYFVDYLTSFLTISDELREKIFKTILQRKTCLLDGCPPHLQPLICDFYKVLSQQINFNSFDHILSGLSTHICREMTFVSEEYLDNICSAFLLSTMTDELITNSPANINKKIISVDNSVLIESLDKVLMSSKQFKTFSGSCRIVAIQSAQNVEKEKINNWICHFSDVCNSIISNCLDGKVDEKSMNTFESCYDFMKELCNDFEIEIPKISCSAEKINQEMENLKTEMNQELKENKKKFFEFLLCYLN
ncbi:Clan CA, family C19, ubiquitin hydrolase-like cysteine peptidase [Trichomonas vaginalis G3]|uniref:Clan CA, family C19, ubiquitin hydrolase-like cysteine peptidase n=1 Tax=Trichomonas vaginalis (strain ATCC PRA-98 / G3) TaxID=412133 RepID=A2F3J4_TRIV3|nr:ubiquitinyl hydrolase protein [Trichomonas vaginalis G3]EAY00517.1 Clan CA, family C19, ubiquitin hydrolase-like cysteine peptidase [Trichomonas vaginalis G3]KAI5550192.1 ubiquitinyl hydrolase protein [Trichomonas vaginalis G3]|eukprot:XP_001313446.1 Clan CA, family C19, ubiquitin hydrolase-like cysteine peptidase [Trichomonas vaginalis G3]